MFSTSCDNTFTENHPLTGNRLRHARHSLYPGHGSVQSVLPRAPGRSAPPLLSLCYPGIHCTQDNAYVHTSSGDLRKYAGEMQSARQYRRQVKAGMVGLLLRVFCHTDLRKSRVTFRSPIIVNERSLVNPFMQFFIAMLLSLVCIAPCILSQRCPAAFPVRPHQVSFHPESDAVLFAVRFRTAVRTADDHQVLRADIESVFADELHAVRNGQFLQRTAV